VQNFADAVKKNGDEVVATEFFNPGNRDFRSILTKISRDKPDAIVLFMFYEESSSLLQQRVQMNIKTPIYSASPSYEPKLLQLAGPLPTASSCPPLSSRQSRSQGEVVRRGYRTRYGSEPSMFAAQAYDATNIMLNAIVAAGPNPTRQKVRDALAATRNFAGVTGDTTFDPKTREPSKTLTRMEIVDGKFKVLR